MLMMVFSLLPKGYLNNSSQPVGGVTQSPRQVGRKTRRPSLASSDHLGSLSELIAFESPARKEEAEGAGHKHPTVF